MKNIEGFQPTRAEDKRVVNGKADINQLMPLKYRGDGHANH